MSDARVLLASWLVEGGAGESARTVLGDARGADANRLRAAADRAALRAGVYALAALPHATSDEAGVVLPLRAEAGVPRAREPELRDACERAATFARALLREPQLPALRFALEEWLPIVGPSIGLPAALAFLAHYLPSRAPTRAVLATGELRADGSVAAVGHMPAKLAAAARERGDALVLRPRDRSAPTFGMEVETLADAARAVFGDAPLVVDRAVVDVYALLARARASRDYQAAAEALSAIPREALAPADRASLLLELGTIRRHQGRTAEARALHDEARALLAAHRRIVGGEAAERHELEHLLTAMDDFRVDEAIAALEARVRAPFLGAENELRARGMLAQALAMGGRFAEAVRVRAANLALHEESAALGATRSGTLCYLALDSARAGESAAFDAYASELLATTRAGDATQARYDAYATVRGLVALGRSREALAWAFDRAPLFAARAPASLVSLATGDDPIAAHPEVSTARALSRAYRASGSPDQAIAIADRVIVRDDARDDLMAFVASLAHLEGALARRDRGEDVAARVDAIRGRMAHAHPRANAFYAALASASLDSLAAAIDAVYY